VIHRDLKPENIILLDEPTDKSAPLKILDFGIARAAGVMESGTGTGLGTPRYMAPEQITNPDTAGPSADLYSLSVLFYELLVDVLPQGHWQPPSGGRSDIPGGIDALIEKGLSNRPSARPQSADEYRKALVQAVNLGPRLKPKTKTNTVHKPTTNKKPVWIGLGLMALFGLGVIGYMESDTPDLPPDDPCAGKFGVDYQNCIKPFGGVFDNDEGDTKETFKKSKDLNAEAERRRRQKEELERRKRAQNPYAGLSGYWNDGIGTIYTINTDSRGNFSGSGTSADGFALTLNGQINGTMGSYILSAPAAGLSYKGTLQWDRGCHLNFATYDAYGQYIVTQGQIHVNHSPGEPCPTR
ncbi:MAG TPA: hypothetical protein ENJ42_10225, partial [Hellea balneolensis]|nr:hypothetical protein [Hellea balneolensis]